ncbi:MAG TPA: hypothetical protein VM012_06290, partial [Flavitalea sp.]|nr:hypothetical protein [Flavitalea sp.]
FSFLYRRFGMQPFNANTLYTVLLGMTAFVVAFYPFHQYIGFLYIMLRSITFIIIYLSGVLYFKLTPDLLPVLVAVKNKIRRR